jgi:hypothetical protein
MKNAKAANYFFKKKKPDVTVIAGLAGPFVQVLLYIDKVFYFI